MKLSKSILSFSFLVLSHQTIAADDVKHLPGIFVGATFVDSETHASFGVEYEYKFTRQWGVGAAYEKTSDAHHGDGITVSTASIFYHPTNNIKLGLGAGQENIGGHHPHSEMLYRATAAYDFHFDNFGVAPTLALDSVDGKTATVFGVAFTHAF